MFDQNVELRGRHATFMKQLVEWQVFRRYLDVYMVGAVLGVLFDRTADEDRESGDNARIFAEQFVRDRAKCEFLYQLVMLVADADQLTDAERIDRAFRVDDASPEALSDNLERFEAYVRGGIEALHERFQSCTTPFDYVSGMYQMVREFECDIQGTSYDERIARLLGL